MSWLDRAWTSPFGVCTDLAGPLATVLGGKGQVGPSSGPAMIPDVCHREREEEDTLHWE